MSYLALHRRFVFVTLMATLLFQLEAFRLNVLLAADTYRLEETVSNADIFGVDSTITIKGELLTPQQDTALSHTLDAKAQVKFVEQRLEGAGRDARAFRSLRQYGKCEAQINVSDNQIKSVLRPERSKVAVHGYRQGLKRVAVEGPLTRNELDLLETPGDSLAITALLPGESVEVGDSWSVPDWAFQMLTATEAVLKSKMSCTLDRVEGNVAHISFKGDLEGATGGSPCTVQIQGEFTFLTDLKYVKSLKLTQKEDRSAGPVSAGLKVTATVDLERYPAVNPDVIPANADELVPVQPTVEELALELKTPWNFTFKHSRNWHVFQQTVSSTTLRYIEDGNFVAQCDLMKLSDVLPGRHVAAKQFQADIRSSLGGQLTELSELKEDKLENGVTTYQVNATGTARDLDMTWIYYLTASPKGNQTSFVYSVESKLLPDLGQEDERMIQSVEFK
ncbi:hypothetical protein Pla110_16340 [Polystyrenella longa]|uniref:Uncharacterized protein n=1 Tax=Polystyrenella longa TaxID=2528007 RepID=A0A518CL61_9PLAN|nr:hypothetical protein [Polystyrenella longa]QDU79914.1 hypothetical protein Pla110_16340 [Polystyrenella longa]